MRMFLTNPHDIMLEDDQGEIVNFKDYSELEFYTGDDFSEYYGLQVDYEPEREMFILFDGIDTSNKPVPDAQLEGWLAQVPVLIARKADITYGLPPEEAHEVAEADALQRLNSEYQFQGAQHGYSSALKQSKDASKLAKAQRKEAKGNANAKDEKILDDNDTLDDWFDAIETDMEDQGEQWIEDPARTTQELLDFDPATDIVWTPYPL